MPPNRIMREFGASKTRVPPQRACGADVTQRSSHRLASELAETLGSIAEVPM